MIKIGPALIEHVDQLERERGIPKDVTLSSLKEAMVAAYKRYAKLNDTHGYECKLLERTGEIGVFQLLDVVKEVKVKPVLSEEELAEIEAAKLEAGPVEPELDDEGNPIEEIRPLEQISLKDARKIKADIELGEILEIEVTPDEFGRIAAQSAKQVIMQRIREAEKMLVQREFEEKRGQVTTGIVQRIEGRNVVVNIGKSEAILPPREQLPGEYYRVGNKLRVFVSDLRDSGRVPQIIVSQAHPAMVREVFELEVPEIEDNIVEIKSIAREAGYRTKVAVTSNDPDVDPQGACIGSRGSRIQAIVNELKNEKIDIIRWSEDPVQFITHALAPAKIVRVEIDAENPNFPRAFVIVPDDQLSLAIGREGQNVRLAAKLTGYKLDIKSLSQVPAPEEQQSYPEEFHQEEVPQSAEFAGEFQPEELASTEQAFEESVEHAVTEEQPAAEETPA
ncbi:MAG: transcription termination factor NusA [Cyanobacteria bacterium]|nr:transcription termination factor NusA [Cyanobacteriota bacterium]